MGIACLFRGHHWRIVQRHWLYVKLVCLRCGAIKQD